MAEATTLAGRSNHPNVILRRANLLLDQGRVEEAEPLLVPYEQEPHPPVVRASAVPAALEALTRLAALCGDVARARAASEVAVDLFLQLGIPGRTAEVHLLMHDVAVQAGDESAAAERIVLAARAATVADDPSLLGRIAW